MTTNGIDHLLHCIAAGRFDGPNPFADRCDFDATVPNWRFQLRSGAEVLRQFRAWFQEPGVLEELHRRPTGDGEVVEYTLCWEERGVPYAAHHVHVITADPSTGQIVRDAFWCGGRWGAALLAEMGALVHAG